MHDRRVDGEPFVFGNASMLFMRAMTWYDHPTESIWSQPWGRAIQGELTGVELRLLPSQLTTWAQWQENHPNSLAMTNDADRAGLRRQGFSEEFVIGLVVGQQSKAYYYEDLDGAGAINDTIGEFPIVVWAGDNRFYAYMRDVEDRTLTFRAEEDVLIDKQTGTRWDVVRGVAVDGPLKGETLAPIPGSTSYDWAWLDFYPDAEFYTP